MGVLGGGTDQQRFLGSREYLDWLKIDLDKTKLITVQNYKCTKS